MLEICSNRKHLKQTDTSNWALRTSVERRLPKIKRWSKWSRQIWHGLQCIRIHGWTRHLTHRVEEMDHQIMIHIISCIFHPEISFCISKYQKKDIEAQKFSIPRMCRSIQIEIHISRLKWCITESKNFPKNQATMINQIRSLKFEFQTKLREIYWKSLDKSYIQQSYSDQITSSI